MGLDLVIVSNRLPVDRVVAPDGSATWRPSPGGLVAALEPTMQAAGGAWVGWSGAPDLELEPFEVRGMRLVPVALSAEEVAGYYEGFSNDTLWPLYHDVIAAPSYHRETWDLYRQVNETFAKAAASVATEGAIVWVHDYQLQLVPQLLRKLRPDLAIGFFDHIPFPPYGLFSQLPWRQQIIEGLLGADVIGFQRSADVANFVTAARRLTGYSTRAVARGADIEAVDAAGRLRQVAARSFPISIDTPGFEALARDERVQARAREIRAGLGDPQTVLLGVDRLDYTKGISHRLKAFGELLQERRIDPAETKLIQVASPSRERVAAYMQLRDEVELTVGRINGVHATLAHTPITYLHQGYPKAEMAALYLAADVMLVTSLRDGMNLVAKEYVASRFDEDGVLILSEFTGASDELRRAILINPHDIDGLKHAILQAISMPKPERRRRMRALRRQVRERDVVRWSKDFLDTLERVAGVATPKFSGTPTAPLRLPWLDRATGPEAFQPPTADLTTALRQLAAVPELLVALDFDGTLSPHVDDPSTSRALPESLEAVRRLVAIGGTRVAFVSGRGRKDLSEVAEAPDGVLLIGSHGAEFPDGLGPHEPDPVEQSLLDALDVVLEHVAAKHEGSWIEAKPYGRVLHTRRVSAEDAAAVRYEALEAVRSQLDVDRLRIRDGHHVVEFATSTATKGHVIERLRQLVGADAVFYAGDDVTDEDAFAALRADDLGVKCGSGPTVAPYRVASPAEIAEVLTTLADLREG
ncbi:MAG TPA: bifunctional alpha,alpha-trehalose-phosphate synthase (UDP-forming)/trehalose-phosphatase [Microbacteriaceae bacterium]|nr:bifunctional alpha,alpha-trehalose-phosphate synthase (UDP-forming)/trehalose-phosphatase [Microbacteriaceae bacterium]